MDNPDSRAPKNKTEEAIRSAVEETAIGIEIKQHEIQRMETTLALLQEIESLARETGLANVRIEIASPINPTEETGVVVTTGRTDIPSAVEKARDRFFDLNKRNTLACEVKIFIILPGGTSVKVPTIHNLAVLRET
jgi:hypothetical protein